MQRIGSGIGFDLLGAGVGKLFARGQRVIAISYLIRIGPVVLLDNLAPVRIFESRFGLINMQFIPVCQAVLVRIGIYRRGAGFEFIIIAQTVVVGIGIVAANTLIVAGFFVKMLGQCICGDNADPNNDGL